MRACFLGQNICALGFGVATLQTAALVMDQPAKPDTPAPDGRGEHFSAEGEKGLPAPPPALFVHTPAL